MLLANADMKSFGSDATLNILYLQNQYYSLVKKIFIQSLSCVVIFQQYMFSGMGGILQQTGFYYLFLRS